MTLRHAQATNSFCCGVTEIGDFSWAGALSRIVERSGTGLFHASFINNPSNKDAYEYLCRNHTLLYQSPLMRNSNSRNQVFMCVFQW